jgi:hypothetical protein
MSGFLKFHFDKPTATITEAPNRHIFVLFVVLSLTMVVNTNTKPLRMAKIAK